MNNGRIEVTDARGVTTVFDALPKIKEEPGVQEKDKEESGEPAVKKQKIEKEEEEKTDWKVRLVWMSDDPEACETCKWRYVHHNGTIKQVFEELEKKIKDVKGAITEINIKWME